MFIYSHSDVHTGPTMADPKKKKKVKTPLEVCTDSGLVCPVCGEEKGHVVYKAKRAFYIPHTEGEKRVVAKIYLRKRMPRVEKPAKEEKAEE